MAKTEATVEGYVLDIAKILENKKAENVVMLDISKSSDLAEYFVLATALNTTHARALCDELEEKLPLLSAKVYKREGQGDWLALDLGDVIVHIFTQEVRNLYHLEKLWSDGKNEFTLAGIEKALEKEKKKAELEEKKNQKAKDREEQKKLKIKEKKEASAKQDETDKNLKTVEKKKASKTSSKAKKDKDAESKEKEDKEIESKEKEDKEVENKAEAKKQKVATKTSSSKTSSKTTKAKKSE